GATGGRRHQPADAGAARPGRDGVRLDPPAVGGRGRHAPPPPPFRGGRAPAAGESPQRHPRHQRHTKGGGRRGSGHRSPPDLRNLPVSYVTLVPLWEIVARGGLPLSLPESTRGDFSRYFTNSGPPGRHARRRALARLPQPFLELRSRTMTLTWWPA